MQKVFLLIVVSTMLALSSCNKTYTPKPRGYFRIDLPEKNYRHTPDVLPYQFEYPKYALIQKSRMTEKELYWINILFPKQRATIHLSYKEIDNNLNNYLEDSRNFVYKHTVKADAISETPYMNFDKNVYGLLYEIKGDAASNIQFYLTDSTAHFLRGSLYFNAIPNKDSLAPVLNFIQEDIVHLIETLEWK